MSYVIYLRKSRKDSDLESLGIDVLERHEKTLLELAKARNFLIGGIYREVVSGDSIDGRPEMKRLLTEVESGIWDGVLVMEVERLARGDTIDQGRVQRAFFYSNTLIITPAKTYDPANEFDSEYFEFNLFMSRREYATIKRRMQTGRVRSVKDGYYVGNIPPYGWKRIKAKDGKHFSLAPNEQEATILKLMYDMMGNKQYGFQKTCTELRKMGILSRSGKPFNPATLKGIIANPVNIGMVRWNYRRTQKHVVGGVVQKSRPKADEYILVKGEHEGCIDPDLFRRANNPHGSMSAPVRKDRPLQNPFAGLVYCSECGHVLIRKKANKSSPHDYLICNYAGCRTVGIQIDEFENALIEWLRNYVEKYNFIAFQDNDSAKIDAQNVLIHNLDESYNTLLKQRSSLFDLLEQGIYTKEIFIERSEALERRIKECQDEIRDANKELNRMRAIQANRANFVPECKHLLDSWDNLDSEGKNSALKSIIDKIIYTKSKKNTKKKKISEFTIDVYPKVPK